MFLVDGLVQDWGNSSALAMELPQSHTKAWDVRRVLANELPQALSCTKSPV